MKMVKMDYVCGWGVRCIPPLKMVKIEKIVKMVRACGWGGGCVPR